MESAALRRPAPEERTAVRSPAERWSARCDAVLERWKAIDDSFYAVMQRRDAGEAERMMDDIAGFQEGEEIVRRPLGNRQAGSPNINPVTVRLFRRLPGKGRVAEAESAYCKPEYGPGALVESARENGVMVFRVYRETVIYKEGRPKRQKELKAVLRWQSYQGGNEVKFGYLPEAGPGLVTDEKELQDRIVPAVERFRYRSQSEADVARRYQVDADALLLPEKKGRMLEMTGLAHERPALNEIAFSRLARLFDCVESVPLSVIRKDGDGLISVQQAVEGDDGMPLQPLSDARVQELGKMGEGAFEEDDDEAKDGFMKLAILDYVFGSADRHRANLLTNFSGKKFFGIDNGLSFGFHRQDEQGNVCAATWIRSLPYSVVIRHPEWKLKNAAVQERFSDLHDRLLNVLREAHVVNPVDSGSILDPEVRYLFEVHEGLYANLEPRTRQRVVMGEMQELLSRLRFIARLGRPPVIPVSQMFDELGEYGFDASSIPVPRETDWEHTAHS
ncbi:MAG: hypothetical protein Q7R83_00860 [bacterium]|nr:hypothetical protein [bacterium]